jgi:hypothetical protein
MEEKGDPDNLFLNSPKMCFYFTFSDFIASYFFEGRMMD